jgi:amino acid permease
LFIVAVGSTFTSARLIYVAGRERYLPAMFGRLHKSRKTPLNAMLLQAALTIMFIVIGGGFRSLMTFSVVASWAFYFLTVSYQQNECYMKLIIFRVGAGTCDLACEGASTGKVSTGGIC